MATLPIDGDKITLIATGKVRPVPVYAELADGSRRRVPDSQEKSDSGVPIWAVDVQLDDDDADRTDAVSVKVPATDEPRPAKWQPITFTGLTCKPYIPKGTHQVALSMRAEGIAPASAAPKSSPKV
jgi:hypothetical protein